MVIISKTYLHDVYNNLDEFNIEEEWVNNDPQKCMKVETQFTQLSCERS